MGFLANAMNNVIGGATNLLGGVTGAAGSLIGSVTPLVTNVVNSPAGVTAATALGGLTGGSIASVGSSFASKMGGASISPTPGSSVSNPEATFWNKLLNIYKLKPETLKDTTNGKEYLNYDLDASGGKQIDVMGLSLRVLAIVTLVVVIHDMAVHKNKRWLFGKK